jgi:hypothetical protein
MAVTRAAEEPRPVFGAWERGRPKLWKREGGWVVEVEMSAGVE